MDRSIIATAAALGLLASAHSNPSSGETTFANYCASCHGHDGSGLLGPNLTDAEILHGSSLTDIKTVIENGIPGKSMPAWNSILTPEDIDLVAKHVQSIMGTNLVGPNQQGKSTVTPFPQGTRDRPLLMRTFMPTLSLKDSIFQNHGLGQGTPKYNPTTGTFDPDKIDPAIPGIPGAIAVNFGDSLSYCFDSTECRLLYTWSGPFLDMTNYWGAGEGGERKRFAYQAEVLAAPSFIANGPAPFAGKPQFLGYKKIQGVPQFEYTVGELKVTLLIEPGDKPGQARCSYQTNAKHPITVSIPQGKSFETSSDRGTIRKGQLQLKADQANAFTLTITPTNSAR